MLQSLKVLGACYLGWACLGLCLVFLVTFRVRNGTRSKSHGTVLALHMLMDLDRTRCSPSGPIPMVGMGKHSWPTGFPIFETIVDLLLCIAYPSIGRVHIEGPWSPSRVQSWSVQTRPAVWPRCRLTSPPPKRSHTGDTWHHPFPFDVSSSPGLRSPVNLRRQCQVSNELVANRRRRAGFRRTMPAMIGDGGYFTYENLLPQPRFRCEKRPRVDRSSGKASDAILQTLSLTQPKQLRDGMPGHVE